MATIHLKELKDAQWEQLRQTTDLVLIDFSASWCGPCKKLAPILEKLSVEYPQVQFLKVDVDDEDSTNLRESFDISAMPTVYIGAACGPRESMVCIQGAQQKELYERALRTVINKRETAPCSSVTTVDDHKS